MPAPQRNKSGVSQKISTGTESNAESVKPTSSFRSLLSKTLAKLELRSKKRQCLEISKPWQISKQRRSGLDGVT